MISAPLFQQALQTHGNIVQGDQVLPLLAEPDSYCACIWNLPDRPEHCAYWLDLFRNHMPTMMAEAVREGIDRGLPEAEAKANARQAEEAFYAVLDELPGDVDPLTILDICIAREKAQNDHGFPDVFRVAKERENNAALAVLPMLLRSLDEMDGQTKWDALIRGIFAGNIFDLGATQTASLFEDGKSVDFHQVLAKLKPRPWVIDDFDALHGKLSSGNAYSRALLFVDNAGCDVVLGMIPFARQLLLSGTQVILTANRRPSLNDITHDELNDLLAAIAHWDAPIREAIATGQLRTVNSGNGLPLIDLSRVSQELVDVVNESPVDFCVLEGMGRGVESNLDVKLTCDVMNIAMIKDQGVADAIGGSLYDLVCRYEQAT